MERIKIVSLITLFCQCALTLNMHQDADTKYPIVLIHGLFGFGGYVSFLGCYWGDIPKVLRQNGAIVYLAEVSQAHKTKVRGEQLVRQLLHWGHHKYNLIGHSFGGLDARYVLENYPEIVASITTIGTPHRGSKVADELSRIFDHNVLIKTFSLLAGNLLGHVIGAMSGHPHSQNSLKALNNLTTEALTRFNAKYSAGLSQNYCEGGEHRYLGSRLYSWGSYRINPGPYHDTISKFFTKTSYAFDDNEDNDGLVSICSMKFGKWLGAIEGGHHLIPIGGIASFITQNHYDWALMMILEHAYRLKRKGL